MKSFVPALLGAAGDRTVLDEAGERNHHHLYQALHAAGLVDLVRLGI